MNRRLSCAESNGRAIITKNEQQDTVKPGNFEDAIKATEFGKFNFALFCVLISGSFAQIAEQTSLSYVIPIAECDLRLSLDQKGLLFSVSYTGMICSAFLWGYICDNYGRRQVIAVGFIGNAVCHVLASLSQNFLMLIISRWLSGFIFTGPFTAFLSYITEFHSTQNRSRVQLLRGLSTGVAVIFLPMMAWIILPNAYETKILNITVRSWNFFIAACGLPALITGVIFMYMPESPRYLMSSGRTSEALIVFKKVYNINTGRRLSSFPVKQLTTEKDQKTCSDDTNQGKLSIKERVLSGLASFKTLFKPPLPIRLIHTTMTNISLSLGAFTVKMWYPQILQSINDYQRDSEADICNVLNSLTYQNSSDVCVVNLDNSSVYINASILGAVQLMAFLLASTLVNKTGKKPLLVILASFSGCCPILIYFIPNGIVMVALLPLIVAFAEVSSNLIITITMEAFPTIVRSTAVNLLIMFSRAGTIGGNMTLPSLLNAGCLPTILFISLAIFVSTILASMLPNTDKKDLQ